MEQKIIRSQIASLLEMLQEQFSRIKSSSEKISQLEVDLLLRNTRQLYEALLALDKINSTLITEAEFSAQAKIVAAITEDKPVKPELTSPSEVMNAAKPGETAGQSGIDKKVIEERSSAIEKKIMPAATSGNLFEEAMIMADRFEGQKTVHDKLTQEKGTESIADKLSGMPLQDLKKSIGINEKFKFMNELFDGNLQEYNEAIEALNSCASFQEAKKFISENLLPKYSWKKESGVYQSLLFLIQRKFKF